MKRIAIFASGTGSNAERIVQRFRNVRDIKVTLIVSNSREAGVVKIADQYQVPSLIIDKEKFYETDDLLMKLEEEKIDLIVLAGFLWLIPEKIIQAYDGKIINVHPSLLPKFGGKGMYGMHVHKAVIESGAKESGITIHYVNREFDKGEIIFQAKCRVDESDNPESLSRKIKKLEHAHFPLVIERLLKT